MNCYHGVWYVLVACGGEWVALATIGPHQVVRSGASAEAAETALHSLIDWMVR